MLLMERILDVFGAIGVWPAIGAGLVWIFVRVFRPQEQHLRRLERLAGLRSALGDRGRVFDGEIDDLVKKVVEDQKNADVRPLQWIYGVVGLIATASGVWMVWTSITGTPEEFRVATGLPSRPGAIGFSVSMTLVVALMTVTSVLWDARRMVELRADHRKMKGDQTAGAEGTPEGDVPTP